MANLTKILIQIADSVAFELETFFLSVKSTCKWAKHSSALRLTYLDDK